MKSAKILKNSDILRVCYISDIHLGNELNPTSHILKNLRGELKDNAETARLDILAICGDFFDRDLPLTSKESIEILVFIYYLLRLCAKHHITLIVLKGTPSHDWDQSKYFKVINDQAKIGADLLYVDTLSIVNLEKYNLDVLFVPDECRIDTDTIYSDTIALMKEKGIKQVDLAIMHGMFDFQLPNITHLDKHKTERWIPLVRQTIVCGHVHSPNSYQNIFIPGSFDRIAQGEEHPKGYLVINYYCKEGVITGYDIERYINEGAMEFKTIDCRGKSLEEVHSLLEELTLTIPKGHWLRIGANTDDHVTPHIGDIAKKFFNHKWSPAKLYDKKKLKRGEKPLVIKRPVKTIRVDKDTILDMVVSKINDLGIDPEKQPWVLDCLAELS